MSTKCSSDQGDGNAPLFLLVHGSWHGAWCWQRLIPLLGAGGAEVHAITLTGLDDGAHLTDIDVTLDTHIEDVIRYLDAKVLQKVVLVGHSYGGVVISGVADRASDRLSRLIYLDALLLENGESIESRWTSPQERAHRSATIETRGPWLPAPPPHIFGVTDTDDQAWLARHLRPQPAGCSMQPLRLTRPLGAGLPKAYIDCTLSTLEILKPMKKTLSEAKHEWRYAAIDTGHDAMITAPAKLAALLLSLAADDRGAA